jgi:hypothetical protein
VGAKLIEFSIVSIAHTSRAVVMMKWKSTYMYISFLANRSTRGTNNSISGISMLEWRAGAELILVRPVTDIPGRYEAGAIVVVVAEGLPPNR